MNATTPSAPVDDQRAEVGDRVEDPGEDAPDDVLPEPKHQSAMLVSTPTSALVSTWTRRKPLICWLMSSMIWTRDLLLGQRRSGDLHQLPLEEIAGHQQEEHQEQHHRELPEEAEHVLAARPQVVGGAERRLDDLDARDARRCVGAGSAAAAAALSISVAARCIFSIALSSARRTARACCARAAGASRSACRRRSTGPAAPACSRRAEPAAQQHDHQRRPDPARARHGAPASPPPARARS